MYHKRKVYTFATNLVIIKFEKFTESQLSLTGKPDLIVTEDEEYKRVNFEKFGKLPTVFQVSRMLKEGRTMFV